MPTNFAPLWTGAFNQANKQELSTRIMNYINKTRIDQFPGGVPNTLTQSGEQWDYPNVWPPMQYVCVEGLRALGTPEACKMSFDWASRWTRSNFIAYKQTRAMFEKVLLTIFNHRKIYSITRKINFFYSISFIQYSAEELGGYGGGGEYEIQLGFGWSNGVILQFLAEYGRDLRSTGSETHLTCDN